MNTSSSQGPDPDLRLDRALRGHLQGDGDPPDDGFSLRVMAALPTRVTPAQRRWARGLRLARWLAMTIVGCGAAQLLTPDSAQGEPTHLMGGLALVGLLIFWAVPSRWNRR